MPETLDSEALTMLCSGVTEFSLGLTQIASQVRVLTGHLTRITLTSFPYFSNYMQDSVIGTMSESTHSSSGQVKMMKGLMLYQISLLKKAFSKLVLENPFLSGKILRQRSDQPIDGKRPGSMTLKISEPPEDMKVSLNDMTLPGPEWKLSYDKLRTNGMPMSKLDRGVLAPEANGQRSEKDRFFGAQVNFIPGGLSALC